MALNVRDSRVHNYPPATAAHAVFAEGLGKPGDLAPTCSFDHLVGAGEQCRRHL
jgi:hypothetical protein